MSLKILSTADLHLGRSASSVPENAEESSTKYTWKRMVDWSVKNEIDVFLLLGDVVDRNNRYYEAIGNLQAGFEKLKQAEIAVYMVAGNHDYDVLPEMVKSDRYNNINLLGFNGEWEVKIFSKNGEQIQFVGWSFPKQFVTEDPLLNFNTVNIDPNYPAIGMLHGDVGNRESKYGPVELNNLTNKPVGAWILGHIHKPQKLKDNAPLIWYPGSPHAMSAKELGIHGPLLLTVESANDIKATPVPLSPVRYEHISVDITKADDEARLRDTITSALFNNANEKVEELEEVAFLVYDIYLVGEHAKIREIESWASPIVNDYEQEMGSGTRLSVRKVVNNVRAAVENLEELAKEPSPTGMLAETILAIQNGRSTDFLDELLKKWNWKSDEMNNSGTYQPLRAAEKVKQKTSEDAKANILQECNRLLGELISQQVK